MRILITGSAGHLGEALMRTLRGTRDAPVGIDIKPSAFTDHVGSVSDRNFVRTCLRGVDAIVHTATLHKPHIATHSHQDFVDTNITGTLTLLEEALAAGVNRFIYTSTTSVFGRALVPPPGTPAAWITEEVTPLPKNIYGVTKFAAENLCELFWRNSGLPCLILRTARFFPEDDDDREARRRFDSDNLKVNEILYRRADLADIVSAHLLAIGKVADLGFERFIISATTPFSREDLPALRTDAAAVVAARFPQYQREYARRGWRMVPAIDRVYANEHARAGLGWAPRYDFGTVLARLADDQDYRSPLAREIGAKGYHAQAYAEGPYPV
jgi:UDP-glucose 4-epimerase